MDAVGGTASVLALVGFALQSTKTIYQAISGIKNGPEQVQQLASAVYNLQLVLTQISTCRAVKLAGPETNLKVITDLIEACNKNVSTYENELMKVQISLNDKKAGKAWKKIKTVLKENDLRRMRTEVNNYVAALGLQLNLLQSDTSFDCKDKLVGLVDAFSERTRNDRRQTMMLQQQNASLSAIEDDMKSHKDTSLSAHKQFREAISSLGQKVERIPDMSAIQSENVCTLIRALQDQISGLSAQIGTPESIPHHVSRSFETSGNAGNIEDLGGQDELLESLGRLSRLAKQKEGTIVDEDAQNIIDDLDILLNAVSMHISPRKHATHPSMKRPIGIVDEGSSINGRDLKRIRGLLNSSLSIDVNQGARRFTPITNSKVTQQNKTKEIQTAHGNIRVATNNRRYSAVPDSSQDEGVAHQTAIEFTASIRSIINHPQFQAIVDVRFHQNVMPHGYCSISPSISVGMILPDDSPVFSLVRNGDVEGLLSLFRQGKASIRDHTSFGTPLLHYATEQPKMCQFLIEIGAEVDELARFPDLDSDCTPLSQELNDSEQEEETMLKRIECRRLLLNAGADPTIGSPGGVTAIAEAAAHGTGESLRSIMDLGASFIDVKQPYGGDYLLFKLAGNYSKGYTPQKFELLLNRGFSIYDRNDQGETCLHICLRRAKFCMFSNEKESLILLVRKGADVLAVDYSGMSISDVAYNAIYRDEEFDLGAYRGDLWDSVLSECGHDISEMRKDYPRIPHYTSKYTRECFERLWLDREEFCPYYNDPPEWDSAGGLDSLQDSEESMTENDEDNEKVLSENDGDKELSSILGNDSAIEESLKQTLSHLEDYNNGTFIDSQIQPQQPTTTQESDMMRLTSLWDDLASSQTDTWGEAFQAGVESNMSVLALGFQDGITLQETILGCDSQSHVGGGNFEPNPWL